MKYPIVKIDRWFWRYSENIVASVRLETFVDPKGRYCILVSERADNPGPNITDAHVALRRAVLDWLKIGPEFLPDWYERYDRESYAPPRSDLDELCCVLFGSGKFHWVHVPTEEWEKIYIDPQRPKPVVKRRKGGL